MEKENLWITREFIEKIYTCVLVWSEKPNPDKKVRSSQYARLNDFPSTSDFVVSVWKPDCELLDSLWQTPDTLEMEVKTGDIPKRVRKYLDRNIALQIIYHEMAEIYGIQVKELLTETDQPEQFGMIIEPQGDSEAHMIFNENEKIRII